MDWADELATKLWQSPGGNKRLRACIAQALRDVQRETASTCSQIAHNRIFIPQGWGCGPELAKQRKIIQEAIEECFLKEKP